jgi:hypothetical protein
VVASRHPGLLAHLVGAEIVDRVATDRFDRNGAWYGWLAVYLPTLVVGTLPWTPLLWRWLRGEARAVRGWRDPNARRRDATLVLLVAWIAVPLAVFCLARSRLPLYLLSLFVPLALIVARQWLAVAPRAAPLAALLAWCALLLALKLAAAQWTTHKDASEWANAIRQRAPFAVWEVVFIDDMARYGLKLHLGAEVEKVSFAALPVVGFNPEYDESLASELREREPGVVYVARRERWPAVRRAVRAAGLRPDPLGAPFRDRVMFAVMPCAQCATEVGDRRSLRTPRPAPRAPPP